MAPLHHRMPVVLDAAGRDAWLDPGSPPGLLQGLLEPVEDDGLAAHPVSRRVNSPANESEDLLDPVRLPGGGTSDPDD